MRWRTPRPPPVTGRSCSTRGPPSRRRWPSTTGSATAPCPASASTPARPAPSSWARICPSGRAAALVLRDRPDALHVRLDGAPERRLAAAVARSGRPEAEVRRLMESADRSREAYVRHFYRADPRSCRHYHLVVDSTVLPLDTV